MSNTKQMGSLDYFKVIAALLVVAIHTSPFTSMSLDFDFVFTRVLARVAVPFFFMITGYFLVPQYLFRKSNEYGPLLKFASKTMLLYLISTIIYIPISVYAGHYQQLDALHLLKMIFFDGTFYHLWYLPASIIGVIIVCFLGSKIGLIPIAMCSTVLYIFGLLGDSYFGVAEQIPVLNTIYQLCFSFFTYTRNGLFFVPIFLVLGAWIHQKRYNITGKQVAIGFVISMLLMLVEALTLRHYMMIRHDSMYIFLIPTMFSFNPCGIYAIVL